MLNCNATLVARCISRLILLHPLEATSMEWDPALNKQTCPCVVPLPCVLVSPRAHSARCNTAAEVAENTTIPRRQNGWDLGPHSSSDTALGKGFTALREFFFFFLCLLFVIYLEAETFKMGKSLLYILKVINMPVPWLPAGLQNAWMKM